MSVMYISVHTTDILNLDISIGSILNDMLLLNCCAEGLVTFRHKHLVRKQSCYNNGG